MAKEKKEIIVPYKLIIHTTASSYEVLVNYLIEMKEILINIFLHFGMEYVMIMYIL